MKYSNAAAAGALMMAASADATPSPLSFEARQASGTSTSLPTVTVRGNAFYAGDNRFYIRGVDYQPGGASDVTDPLSNTNVCQRDIPYFKQLGINTIRVYTVDNSANHDVCMNALAQAGIYVALDINTPKYSINRENPGPSYNPTYLQSIFATMDVFSKYTNTLAFFNGNEVINNKTNTNTAPFVKAVGRDMKTYRTSRNLRAVPIGYSAADVAENRYQTALYFNCGTDDQRSDFFAFNDYSWCNPQTYSGSDWPQKVQQYSNYTLPIFMSEYGCIQTKRTFAEVAPLYKEMTPVYSGGLVYEYTEEPNKYGLVVVNGNSVTLKDDFTALSNAFKSNPVPTGDGGARTSDTKANDCPPVTDEWELSAYPGANLPATPSGALTFFKNGAGAGPGLKGDGSQNAPGGSTGTATPGSGSATPVVSGSGAATSTGAAAGGLHHSSAFGYGSVAACAAVMFGTLAGALLL